MFPKVTQDKVCLGWCGVLGKVLLRKGLGKGGASRGRKTIGCQRRLRERGINWKKRGKAKKGWAEDVLKRGRVGSRHEQE